MDVRSLHATDCSKGEGGGRRGELTRTIRQVRPDGGVCLALQCLPFMQACISNVIYYLGDVCSRCVSDEKALLSKVLPPGM